MLRIREQVELPAFHPLTFMKEKLSFAERVARLQTAAESLRVILEIVEAEAKAISDVHKRYSAKKPQPRSANSAE